MITKAILLLVCICASFPAHAISADEARHLLARTGFGLPTPEETTRLAALSYDQAVDHLLSGLNTQPATAPPHWISTLPPTAKDRKNWTIDQKKAFRMQSREQGKILKAWWVKEMLVTKSPLTEHLTLFWHNHFTSSLKKVKWAGFMYQQNQLFRRHSAGNFAELLKAVAKDPAMLIYLDGQKNKKGQANENFAREVMELFTLGEGSFYTEHDIRDAARAFTGWGVNQKTGTFRNRKKFHDGGQKTVLGKTGPLDGEQVIELLLAQSHTADFVSRKLWHNFVGAAPTATRASELAAVFRDNRYEIRPLLKTIFLSKEFRSPQERGQMIKSPIDLIIGSVRFFNRADISPMIVTNLLRRLGQDLLDPPNVKGWAGERLGLPHKPWPSETTFFIKSRVACA